MDIETDTINDPAPPENTPSANPAPSHSSEPSPAQLGSLIAQAETSALADNTRKTYNTGWNSWTRWAHKRGHQTLPAEPHHLLYWLATLFLQGKKPATQCTYLAAVAYKHRDRPGPNPAKHPRVRKLLSGLIRMAAANGGTSNQAAPLRWGNLLEIVEAARKPRSNQPGGRLETPQQAQRRAQTDIAMICIAHDAALRCSELLALIWADIDLTADGECGTVRIRTSKTDQTGQGAVVPISQCTTQALARIRPADARPEDPVFKISPSTVTRCIKAATKAAGIDPANITSHSLRVGMAQDLVAFGIDLPGLMQACRWKSARMAAHYTRNIAAQQTPAAQYLKTQDRAANSATHG
ncbi:tyrosine-type recombinase/integrase [Candidatus Poriferisocius sp.]|uniref:tyrosine-type recombinase/integrase n=1 Tax=Candidatus Poriferisocius sp. TaxID=3101276 RepID=UPI003B026CD7